MPSVKLIIIALLACGVGFFALAINTTSCGGRSPTMMTTILVRNVYAIATEYEVRTGKVPPGSHESDAASIKAFLEAVTTEAVTTQMIMNLGRDYITLDENGQVTGINDAWGRSLWYVPYNDGQTNRLPTRGSEEAVHPMVLSAGADGNWGTYKGERPDSRAGDNVHSYQQ